MYYTTEQDAREATVSKATALRELDNHGMSQKDVDLFLKEVGNKEEYEGSEVLNWLGY